MWRVRRRGFRSGDGKGVRRGFAGGGDEGGGGKEAKREVRWGRGLGRGEGGILRGLGVGGEVKWVFCRDGGCGELGRGLVERGLFGVAVVSRE